MTFHPVGQTIGNLVPPLTIANGGTGQTTQSAALTALLGASAVPVANGGTGTTGQSGVAPFQPADAGMLAWNFDPAAAASTAACTAGSIYLMRIDVRVAFTATNILLALTTVSSGTSTGTFVGLYNSSGTLLSGSSDLIATFNGTTGVKTLALTTPQALSAGTFVWAAVLTNASVTQPTFSKTSAVGLTYNAGLAVSSARAGVGATVQTSLIAITPASITLTGFNGFWVGIS